MSLNLDVIRQQFPSLNRNAIFFDNPGGTQIAKQSIDRITKYLIENNANHGGAFATSMASDEVLHEAHNAMADFYNAPSADEIVFGNNMTTLTLHISRSISREWKEGDEIVVTRLDHDANVTPWVLAAQDKTQGIVVAAIECGAFVIEHPCRVEEIVFQLANQGAIAQHRVQAAQVVRQVDRRTTAVEPLSVPVLQ